jgi:hypothetical protein
VIVEASPQYLGLACPSVFLQQLDADASGGRPYRRLPVVSEIMYYVEASSIAEGVDQVSFVLPSSDCPALLAASERGEVLVVESPDVVAIAGRTVVQFKPLEASDAPYTPDLLVQVTLHEVLHVSRRKHVTDMEAS